MLCLTAKLVASPDGGGPGYRVSHAADRVVLTGWQRGLVK